MSSGISAFRTKDGLWNQVDVEKYATPQGSKTTHKPYETGIGNAGEALPYVNQTRSPRLARTSWRHATQNVDDLLERSGCGNILHLHGTLLVNAAITTVGTKPRSTWRGRPPEVCPECNAPTRPDVVWFYEPLHEQVIEQAEQGRCRAICSW